MPLDCVSKAEPLEETHRDAEGEEDTEGTNPPAWYFIISQYTTTPVIACQSF